MQLNKAQMEAATHKEGPLLVVAAPGSGKTSVICNRVHYLIEEGRILPERICVLTFTKEAALEMQKRINQNHFYPVCLGTIHSLCYQILSQHGSLHSKELLTSSQRSTLIRRILQEQHSQEHEYYAGPQEVEAVANEFTRFSSTFETAFQNDLSNPYGLYRKRKQQLGVMDFDDLLTETWKLLTRKKEICEVWQQRFDQILIDEFQDINEIQFELLRILAAKHENIMAVGDDDQSIYGFRGASPDILKNFKEIYPNCKTILLEHNYRCPDLVIACSQKSIRHNHHRFQKQILGTGEKQGSVQCLKFDSEQEQASYIKNLIKEYKQDLTKKEKEAQKNHTAILFRTGRQKETFCALLDREMGTEQICWKLKMELMQDLRHYLAILSKHADLQDILAVMNHPERGLSRMYMPVEGFTLLQWEQFCLRCKEEQQAKSVQEFRTQMEQARNLGADLGIRYLMDICGYKNYIINKYNKNEIEIQDLILAYETVLYKIKSLNWKELELKLNLEITNLNKECEERKSRREKNEGEGVSFLTMHSCKGLEFENVIIPDLNEGTLPSPKSIRQNEIEQERRLFYVAMTRTRKNLVLTYVDKEGKHKKSRFLSELGL